MKVKNDSKSRRKKLSIIISIIVGGLAVVSIWFFYFQPRIPHPLGDQLEYIGKRDYGCNWLCDSPPSTTYFYTTDMTPPELADYFQNARATESQFQIERWQNRGQSFHIDFINEDSSERFTIYFYLDPSEQETGIELTSHIKRYVISLNSNYYQVVKDSL